MSWSICSETLYLVFERLQSGPSGHDVTFYVTSCLLMNDAVIVRTFSKVWVHFAMCNKSGVRSCHLCYSISCYRNQFFNGFFPPQQVPLHCIVNANFLGFQWQQRQKFLLCRKVITMCAQLAVPYYCSPQTHQTEVNTRSTCAGPNLAFSLHLLTVFKPS